MPLFYRDLHLRALEAAYHRHYDQLCAVAAAVLGGDAARTMLTDATDGHLDKTLVVESKEDITLEEMKGHNFLFYPAADAYYEVTYTSELAETAYRIIQNMD